MWRERSRGKTGYRKEEESWGNIRKEEGEKTSSSYRCEVRQRIRQTTDEEEREIEKRLRETSIRRSPSLSDKDCETPHDSKKRKKAPYLPWSPFIRRRGDHASTRENPYPLPSAKRIGTAQANGEGEERGKNLGGRRTGA